MVLVVSTFSVIVLANIFLNSIPNIFLFSIVVISAVLAATKRVPVNFILIASAVAGLLFLH